MLVLSNEAIKLLEEIKDTLQDLDYFWDIYNQNIDKDNDARDNIEIYYNHLDSLYEELEEETKDLDFVYKIREMKNLEEILSKAEQESKDTSYWDKYEELEQLYRA